MRKPTPPRKTTAHGGLPGHPIVSRATRSYAQADSPIAPELKQAIAEEVQQQIPYENAASAEAL